MTEDTLTAAIGALAVLGVAAFGWLTTAQIAARKRFNRIMRENRALWYYTRHLIDWGYRPRVDGELPPQPPDAIKHLYEFGEPS